MATVAAGGTSIQVAARRPLGSSRRVRSLTAVLVATIAAALLPASMAGPVRAAVVTRHAYELLESNGTRDGVIESPPHTIAAARIVLWPGAAFDPDTVHILAGGAQLFLIGPDGAPIAPGTYTDVTQAYEPQPGRAGFTADFLPACTDADLTVTVHEIVLSGDAITTLAMDYGLTCDGTPRGAGQLRIASGVSMTALDASHDEFTVRPFGQVVVGQHHDEPWTFANLGDEPVTLGTIGFGGADPGAFQAVADGCSGATLDAGESCQATIRFAPASIGFKTATVAVATDTPLGTRRESLEGVGGTASSVTLTAPTEIVFPGANAVFTAKVTPAPTGVARGYMVPSYDGQHSGQGYDVAADGTATISIPYEYLPVGPGTHEIFVTYTGGGDQQLVSSVSPTRSFTVGIGTTTTLTLSTPTALSTEPVTVAAAVVPASGTLPGGTLSIVDTTTGTTIATTTVGATTSSVSVTRTFAAGPHALVATYAGAGIYASSSDADALAITADTVVAASGVGVSSSWIYPVKDGYRDTVVARGTLAEPAKVLIRAYSPTGRLVRTWDLGMRQAGAYSVTWTGRRADGTILPEGKYRIVQRLVDRGGTVLTNTRYVTLSKKKLVWRSHAIGLLGERFDRYGSAGTGRVSRAGSAFADGVRITSGSSGYAAIRYPFTLRSGVLYRGLAFRVLGRSTNSRQALAGLWNWDAGSPLDAGNYDARAVGTAYKWYVIRGDAYVNRKGRTTYGMVLADAFAGPTGAKGFDVARVQLVYQYAILTY